MTQFELEHARAQLREWGRRMGESEAAVERMWEHFGTLDDDEQWALYERRDWEQLAADTASSTGWVAPKNDEVDAPAWFTVYVDKAMISGLTEAQCEHLVQLALVKPRGQHDISYYAHPDVKLDEVKAALTLQALGHQPKCDEHWLAEEIRSMFGTHGAHMEVLGMLLTKAGIESPWALPLPKGVLTAHEEGVLAMCDEVAYELQEPFTLDDVPDLRVCLARRIKELQRKKAGK